MGLLETEVYQLKKEVGGRMEGESWREKGEVLEATPSMGVCGCSKSVFVYGECVCV